MYIIDMNPLLVFANIGSAIFAFELAVEKLETVVSSAGKAVNLSWILHLMFKKAL